LRKTAKNKLFPEMCLYSLYAGTAKPSLEVESLYNPPLLPGALFLFIAKKIDQRKFSIHPAPISHNAVLCCVATTKA
jgi:hypothetical protein